MQILYFVDKNWDFICIHWRPPKITISCKRFIYKSIETFPLSSSREQINLFCKPVCQLNGETQIIQDILDNVFHYDLNEAKTRLLAQFLNPQAVAYAKFNRIFCMLVWSSSIIWGRLKNQRSLTQSLGSVVFGISNDRKTSHNFKYRRTWGYGCMLMTHRRPEISNMWNVKTGISDYNHSLNSRRTDPHCICSTQVWYVLAIIRSLCFESIVELSWVISSLWFISFEVLMWPPTNPSQQ